MGFPETGLSINFTSNNFSITGHSDTLRRAKYSTEYTTSHDPKTDLQTYTFEKGAFAYFDELNANDVGPVRVTSSVKEGETVSNYAHDSLGPWNRYSGIALPEKTTVNYDLGKGKVSQNNHDGFFGGLRYYTAGWFTYNSGCKFEELNVDGKGQSDFVVYKN